LHQIEKVINPSEDHGEGSEIKGPTKVSRWKRAAGLASGLSKGKQAAQETIAKFQAAAMLQVSSLGKGGAEKRAASGEASKISAVSEEVLSQMPPSGLVRELRLMYRKSVEYRVAHSLFETKYRKIRILMGFVHLVLTSITGAVLFLGLPEIIALMFSFLLTGLNGVMAAVNVGELEAQHTEARRVFAGLQRYFATVLSLSKKEDIKKNFTKYAEKYSAAVSRAPKIPGIHKLKNKDTGAPLFHLITEQALLAEAQGIETPSATISKPAHDIEAGITVSNDEESKAPAAESPVATQEQEASVSKVASVKKEAPTAEVVSASAQVPAAEMTTATAAAPKEDGPGGFNPLRSQGQDL